MSVTTINTLELSDWQSNCIQTKLSRRSIPKQIVFLLLTLGLLATQSRVPWFELTPKNTAGSVLVLAWSVGAFVLMMSYSNTLLASIVAEDLEAPLYTFEALANDLEKKNGDTWIVEVLHSTIS